MIHLSGCMSSRGKGGGVNVRPVPGVPDRKRDHHLRSAQTSLRSKLVTFRGMRISSVLRSFPFFLLAVSAQLTPVSYDNTKVIRMSVSDASRLNYFDATINALGLSTWSSVHQPNTLIDVQVPAALLTQFNDAFDGWKTQVIHEDLGESIRAESEVPKKNPSEYHQSGHLLLLLRLVRLDAKEGDDWFDAFHSYADHQAWLQQLIKTYPNNTQSVSSGKSTQGQDITGVHIYGSKGPGGSPAVSTYSKRRFGWLTFALTRSFSMEQFTPVNGSGQWYVPFHNHSYPQANLLYRSTNIWPTLSYLPTPQTQRPSPFSTLLISTFSLS